MSYLPESLRADLQDARTLRFWIEISRRLAVVLIMLVGCSFVSKLRLFNELGAFSFDQLLYSSWMAIIASLIGSLMVLPTIIWNKASRLAGIGLLVISILVNPLVLWLAFSVAIQAVAHIE